MGFGSAHVGFRLACGFCSRGKKVMLFCRIRSVRGRVRRDSRA